MSTSPATARLPTPAPAEAPGTPAQRAFREVVQSVERLREQLRTRRAARAEARRHYWQQVGPVAAAVVAARRALFAPLEEALLLGYFSRLEETQITELIVSNVRALEERFGEDEGELRRKYAPPSRGTGAAETGVAVEAGEAGETADSTAATGAADPAEAAAAAASTETAAADAAATFETASFDDAAALPPHEQAAAAARARRKTKAQRRQEAAALAEQRQLAANAKTLYRQLARTHHPDLERDPARQAHRTAQMQRITAAYEADDLYALLELLAEGGPADAAADDVLARYTRALHQQQGQLRQELNALTHSPDRLDSGSPKQQKLALRQLKRDLRAEAEYLAVVGRQLREPEGLRELLRQLGGAGL